MTPPITTMETTMRQPHATLRLFPLGQANFTRGIIALIGDNPEATMRGILAAVSRHAHGDWGDLDEEDRAENDLSLDRGYRLLSAYHVPTWADDYDDPTKIWVITEADRSLTTVLLPEEY
jgi:hypothetical protein